MLYGALEAGGTKMVCAIGDEHGNLQEIKTFPTLTPEETMPGLIAFFKGYPIQALGIGCFGPVDLNPKSSTYGHITSTPKLAWRNYDIYGAFREALQVPIGFDTDVNGSCLGEITYGAAKGLDSVAYITIGTGVGVGIYVDGKLLHGMMHAEGGHMLVKKYPGDTFEGACPYHGDCIEGLCAGGSIEKRYGKKAYLVAEEDEVWTYTGYYIAELIVNLILTVSPKRVILGGGVMKQKQLFPIIREQVPKLLNGYVLKEELQDMNQYIVEPGCGDNQGILGALLLGYHAAK